jgi:hypothetical protein
VLFVCDAKVAGSGDAPKSPSGGSAKRAAAKQDKLAKLRRASAGGVKKVVGKKVRQNDCKQVLHQWMWRNNYILYTGLQVFPALFFLIFII